MEMRLLLSAAGLECSCGIKRSSSELFGYPVCEPLCSLFYFSTQKKENLGLSYMQL